MTYKEAIENVSKETGLPLNIIEKTYKAYWLYIKSTIQKLPLKKSLTEDEFSSLRTCFNIPSLGKISCTYERYVNVKKWLEYTEMCRKKNEKSNKNQAPVQ